MRANVRRHLEKCRAAALAAVEVYNRPGTQFRTPHYILLISVAWTALFHAFFYGKGRRPWYRTGTGKGTRYQKVEGEPKHWELAECLKQHYGDKNPAERANLRFLIGLRNKIEHRHLPDLDAAVYGECQAGLMNLEDLLVREFGPRYALMESLAVSLQFSRVLPAQKAAAAQRLASQEARDVLEYIKCFRGGLGGDVLSSAAYSFSVYLVPKIVNRESAADLAVEFVNYDPGDPEQAEKLQQVTAMIRERQVPVANLNLKRPSEIVAAVRSRIPFRFTLGTHAKAWRHYGVRPPTGSALPQKTDSRYCMYDRAHADYVYTDAWIERLVRELSDGDTYRKVVGEALIGVSAIAGGQ